MLRRSRRREGGEISRRVCVDCVPLLGRAVNKSDASVWAVTYVFTRAGYRRGGVSFALASAAIGFARARGARALEAYPMLTAPGEEIAWGELHVGSRSIFAAAGSSRSAGRRRDGW